MTTIQYIALICSFAFLFFVFWSIYRGWLREGYALLWIFITCGMIVLAIVPHLMDFIAKKVQIYTPPFVLVLFMLGGMVILLFQQSLIISKHNEKIKHLTEELALLKAEEKYSNDTDN